MIGFMKNEAIFEAIRLQITFILAPKAQESSLTAASFQSHLHELRQSLCAALLVTDEYAQELEFAIENQLFLDFAEVQQRTLDQLPKLLATLASQSLNSQSYPLVAVSHGCGLCYCAATDQHKDQTS